MALFDSTDITRIKAITTWEVSVASDKDTVINEAGHTDDWTLCPTKNFVTVDGDSIGWVAPE